MYSTFCNFLTVPVIVIFKVLHYSHLGGVLPESGVPEGDILISLHWWYIFAFQKLKLVRQKYIRWSRLSRLQAQNLSRRTAKIYSRTRYLHLEKSQQILRKCNQEVDSISSRYITRQRPCKVFLGQIGANLLIYIQLGYTFLIKDV